MADEQLPTPATSTGSLFVGDLTDFLATYPWLANTAADDDCQIEATNDVEAIECWLYAYRERSTHTQAAYRKEAVRYLLWLMLEQKQSLSEANQVTVEAYKAFLVKPAAHWCGPRRALGHPDWRPFQKPLSSKSQADALAAIKTLCNWLVDAGYLRRNPFKLIKGRAEESTQQRNQRTQAREHVFFEAEWQLVLAGIERFPRDTVIHEASYQRALFLIHFLYYLGPRASEVVATDMGSFRQIDGRWWWTVTGKGGVDRKVPVAKTMLKALRLYRLSLGLEAAPVPGETTALLYSLYGQHLPLTTRQSVYNVVKAVFRQACELTDDMTAKEKLQQASTHWLRHTFATRMHQVGISEATRQEVLGHANRATTEIYTHFEDNQVHDEFDKL